MALIELRRTRAYEVRVLHRFDRVAVTSPVDARALQALASGSDVAVVPNGVDTDRFRPVPGPREPTTLVFWGKMSYHANVTAVLHFVHEIFPRVRALRGDVRLRIVGSDPPRAVRALARDPAVSVTGYVEDLPVAVGQATIAICPVTVKVGIQNKVLEALALGLPVVATPAGVEGLAVRPGRDLVVADQPAKFADEVCRLLADAALRERLGQSGRDFVTDHHQWATAAEQVEALYVEVRARHARHIAGGSRDPVG
jgi:glycosyltransferase involved in cell wall biosynthesis